MSLSFDDDGGGVRVPASYALQHQRADGSWADVPGQRRSPATPAGRAVNRITVDPPLITNRLRVVAPGAYGITAFQLWRRS